MFAPRWHSHGMLLVLAVATVDAAVAIHQDAIMPDLVLTTSDGVTVTLSEAVYRDKILPKHPEISVADIEAALARPMYIYDHLTEADSRVYDGAVRTRGFYAQNFTRVIVDLQDPQHGCVITAYLEIRPYRGTQRWP